MKKVEPIQNFDQIKALADERRRDILGLLMTKPATLSHLAHNLGQSPAWVRHHIQTLKAANLVELSEIRKTEKVTEKFYRAKAGAFLMQELVLPKGDKPVLIFSGSHDLAIEWAGDYLEKFVQFLIMPVGSLNGFVNLRQGLCQVSGAHLCDETGEYNTAYVRRFFPDRDIDMVTLAHRTQGLILAPGNPLGIQSITDLTRKDIRFVNRNPGSGTRLWLDGELKRLGISLEKIHGYHNSALTHFETAKAVANGQADVALGLQAAAIKFELEFIPLFNERYDLIFPHEFSEQLNILLNYIHSKEFRQKLSGFGGYQSTETGNQVALN